MKVFGNFINGEWKETSDIGTILDKYTQEPISKISLASRQDMEMAIDVAKQSFLTFRRTSAAERSKALYFLADLIEEERSVLTKAIVQEAGKPIAYAEGEIKRCISTVRLAAAEALVFTGETVNIDFDAGVGLEAFTKNFPIGVIGCITPFNFPLNLVLHKIAPALAVGCTVVLKPAPQTPLSSLLLAKLIAKSGFPKGVVNVLCCENDVAEELVKSDKIAMISFTGSDQVGWHLKEICGRKKIALELGGNAACIVDASANIQVAAKKIAMGSFLYAGQICISTQRVFIHDEVYDDFLDLLLNETKALESGHPSSEKVSNGPIISKHHFHRIQSWVQEAVNNGAQVLAGGQPFDEDRNIFQPTLLSHVPKSNKLWNKEVFGPVAIVQKVKSFDEAICLTNDSEFGLQVGVFTNELTHLKKAHNELEVGGVIINNIPGFRVDNMPYGGVKASGLGREGVKYAMQDYTEPRLLVY